MTALVSMLLGFSVRITLTCIHEYATTCATNRSFVYTATFQFVQVLIKQNVDDFAFIPAPDTNHIASYSRLINIATFLNKMENRYREVV